MKPGKRDRKYSIKITGAELAAFKECCLDLPESFGLDRRIAAYQGTRAIGFWRWDLDCLVDTLEFELKRAAEKPRRFNRRTPAGRESLQAAVERLKALRPPPDVQALQSLFERFKALREQAYEEIDD